MGYINKMIPALVITFHKLIYFLEIFMKIIYYMEKSNCFQKMGED